MYFWNQNNYYFEVCLCSKITLIYWYKWRLRFLDRWRSWGLSEKGTEPHSCCQHHFSVLLAITWGRCKSPCSSAQHSSTSCSLGIRKGGTLGAQSCTQCQQWDTHPWKSQPATSAARSSGTNQCPLLCPLPIWRKDRTLHHFSFFFFSPPQRRTCQVCIFFSWTVSSFWC